MTEIIDFSRPTRKMINNNINRPFTDVIPKLERWFGSTGGLTRNRLIFFERYWGENYVPKTRFEYEDELQQLKAMYLRHHARNRISIDKAGRIHIRNARGHFVRQPRYFKELYIKHNR